MRSFVVLLLAFLVACGGGGGGSDTDALSDNQGEGTGGEAQPTAAELFLDCFQQDATQLAQVLGLLEQFFGENPTEVPLPTLDLLGGLLGGGVFPYTWDLDGDETNELSGSFRFIDENGATTIPLNVGDLSGLDLNDPTSLLGAVPAGSRVELTFALGGALLIATNEGSGDGTLVFTFGEDAITSIGGDGTFTSGECQFAINFDDITLDPGSILGFPVAELGFTAAVGDDSLSGTIDLDGTATASVTAQLNDGPVEQFEFELPAAILPDLP